MFRMLAGAALLVTSLTAHAANPTCDKNHYILQPAPGYCSPGSDDAATARSVPGSPVPGFYPVRRFPQPDGSTFIAGTVSHRGVRPGYDMALVRVGPDDTLDLAFASGGLARLPVWGDYEAAGAVAVQPDGRIVVAGVAGDPTRPAICAYDDCGAYGVVMRLLPDARVDPDFNGGAPLILSIGHLASYDGVQPDGQYIEAVEVQPDGSIAVFDGIAMRTTTQRRMIARIDAQGALDDTFTGPIAVRLPEFEPVIEYYNAQLDHYFYTANRAEFSLLDLGGYTGWMRTYRAFHAWLPAGARASVPTPVCRLYGDARFGLNTHFYSGNQSECDALLGTGAWTLESRAAFRMDVPDANGACPAGDLRVYRLWNGRPDTNSRYTTNAAVRDQMLAQGWQQVGDGTDAAVMCAAP